MAQQIPKWIQGLDEADLAFVKRFVLASGSLKDVAQQYGVTYPTLRLRLNRLINRIKALDDQREPSDFRRYVKSLAMDGRLDLQTAKELMRMHEKEITEGEE